jgi:hypothetical protein
MMSLMTYAISYLYLHNEPKFCGYHITWPHIPEDCILKADSHIPCRFKVRFTHTTPFPCHSPSQTPLCFTLATASEISMLLITNFLELAVVERQEAKSWQVANMPSHAVTLPPRPCHGLERSLSERHIRVMAGERHGMCESNTAALCKSNGKDTI